MNEEKYLGKSLQLTIVKEPFKNYKGLWEIHFSDGVKAEYTTKKGLQAFIKKHMAGEKKKACMICGNDKQIELEPIIVFSDSDGNEAEEKEYLCKENKGCNK